MNSVKDKSELSGRPHDTKRIFTKIHVQALRKLVSPTHINQHSSHNAKKEICYFMSKPVHLKEMTQDTEHRTH